MHVDAGADMDEGLDHTTMLTASGRVFSCGANDCGQLGHGDTEDRSVPTEVMALASQRVVSVAAAGGFSLAITAGGDTLHWGLRFESIGADDKELQTQPARLWSFPTAGPGPAA